MANCTISNLINFRQVKNDANSSGTVWICNGCRHRPLPNQQKINDRNIESERLVKLEEQGRPSLIRQTSEHSDRGSIQALANSDSAAEQAKFRINHKPRKSHHDPKQQQQPHTHKTTKRSPPLGELADSGIASLSLEDPNCPVNCPIAPPPPTQHQQQHEKKDKIQHSYVPMATHHHSRTLHTHQPPSSDQVELDPKSATLPSDTRAAKVRPKKRYLPRNPSLGSECGDYLPFEHLQRQRKQLSQVFS